MEINDHARGRRVVGPIAGATLGRSFAIVADTILYTTSKLLNGGVDFNGDGDALDSVLFDDSVATGVSAVRNPRPRLRPPGRTTLGPRGPTV